MPEMTVFHNALIFYEDSYFVNFHIFVYYRKTGKYWKAEKETKIFSPSKTTTLHMKMHKSQKVKDEWTTELNVKCKTVTLLEDNTGENLGDLENSDDFLDITPKTWNMKKIIDQLDFIKIKNFRSTKNNVKRVRR